MQRGESVAPVFPAPSAAAETIAIAVPAPVAPEARFEAELHGPRGMLLRRGASRLELDPLARTRFAVPASLLRVDGRYELLLRETTGDGDPPREFVYPFRVEANPPID